MPSIAKSKSWYIRITAPHSFIKDKLNIMKGWIDFSGMFVGLHNPDKDDENPHCHIALKILSEIQKQSLDTRIKKLFEVSGAQYSSKVWDSDTRALAYMYHDEKAEIINLLGLTDAEISELRRTNELVQKQVAVAKEKSSHKILDYAVSKCDTSSTQSDIGYVILKAIGDGLFHHPGPFRLKAYILEVELILRKDSPARERDQIIWKQLRDLNLN